MGEKGRLWCTLAHNHDGMHYDAGANRYFIRNQQSWHYPPNDSNGHSTYECEERKCFDDSHE